MPVTVEPSLLDALRAFARQVASDTPPPAANFSPSVNPYAKPMKNGFLFRNLRQILPTALKHHFLVPAINIRSPFVLEAALEAAFQEHSPLILECSETESSYCNLMPERLGPMAHEYVSRMIATYGYVVPLTLHLDHVQKDLTLIDRAVQSGYSSALADLSKKPLDENIATVRPIIKKYHPMGVSFEVEEGEIGIAASLADPEIDANIEKYYTTVENAYKLVAAVRPDAMAIFVGNGHGKYLKTPRIGFDRIREISEALREFGFDGGSVPIVLHGGSYLSEETFRKCAEAGAAKVNYATSVSDVMFDCLPSQMVADMDAMAKEKNTERRKVLKYFEDKIAALPKTQLTAMVQNMTDHVRHFMREGWLSSDKAKLYQK